MRHQAECKEKARKVLVQGQLLVNDRKREEAWTELTRVLREARQLEIKLDGLRQSELSWQSIIRFYDLTEIELQLGPIALLEILQLDVLRED